LNNLSAVLGVSLLAFARDTLLHFSKDVEREEEAEKKNEKEIMMRQLLARPRIDSVSFDCRGALVSRRFLCALVSSPKTASL
jgi:hypothetical protein